jgi:hypothetical protein
MTRFANDNRVLSPLSEDQEIELASELMDVGSDAELDQFLGGLISTLGRDASRFLRSSTGKALGGILEGVAKKALPMVGGALGSTLLPGVGTVVGSQLGSIASGMFEMEVGSMPEEEAEFETARRVVQLMAAAASQAVQASSRSDLSPKAAAWDAVLQAARRYAPGLYRQLTQPPARAAAVAVAGNGADASEAEDYLGGRRMPGSQWGNGPRPGFRQRHPIGGGGLVVDEPVVDEPVLPGWAPDGQASLEIDDQPGPTASGTWERQGRRIILRGV